MTRPRSDVPSNSRSVTRAMKKSSSKSEAEVQRIKRELEDFVENATIGLHWVGPDGIILWANRAELEMLGYSRDQYVGRHIGEFHVDQDVIDDILKRLTNNEVLRDYPARMRASNGSVKHVLIDSSVLFEKGEFIHTRCFTRDVTGQKQIEDALRLSERNAAFLAGASSVLTESLDSETIVRQLATLFVPDFAEGAWVDLADRDSFTRVAVAFADPKLQPLARKFMRRFPMRDRPTGVARSFRTGEVVQHNVIDDDVLDQMAVDEEHLSILREIRPKSIVSVPLTSRSTTFGVLTVARTKTRAQFENPDVALVREVGHRAALAIDNAKLYEASERDRATLRESEERWRFISEASDLLVSTLDWEDRLTTLTRLVVPRIADWCTIDIAEKDSFSTVAFHHDDPAKLAVMTGIASRSEPDSNHRTWIGKVVHDQSPLLISDVTHDTLARYSQDHTHPSMFESIGAVSLMVLPLTVRGKSLGAITFGSSESRRRFRERDLEFAEEIARRAAFFLENARLYAETQQANRAKDEFLATLSHELRTPMTAILGWSRFLSTTPADPTTLETAIDAIQRSAVAQSQLIDDVLDMSRIASGKLRLEVQPIDIAAVVRAAFDTLEPASLAKGIHVILEDEPSTGILWADPNRMQQAIWNLISNAIKFTARGGTVSVRILRTRSEVIIEVKDTGQGITPEFLPHVFEPFRQAESASTRAHGGLGLGLAITRHLVELHGGRIHAESNGVGTGATFTMTLPAIAARVDGLRRPVSEQPPRVVQYPSFNGKRVLFVDDQDEARRFVRAVLERCGADVRDCSSVADALTAVDGWQPDVIISDIAMPERDGYEFVKLLRAKSTALESVPMLALTAYGGAEERGRVLAAGFVDCLRKPIDPSQLAIAVQKTSRVSF